MIKSIGLIILTAVSVAGCAGRQADPVAAYKPGDENMTCESLKQQISSIQDDMLALLPKTDKTLANTLWSVGGSVASNTTPMGMASYLFIDMKDADRIEYEALRRRHNRLLLITQAKHCDLNDIRAETIPSLAQRKAMEKERKNAKSDKTASSQ